MLKFRLIPTTNMTIESMPTSLFSDLKNKIEQKQARVAVIGLGYVGLPLALLYTEQKFSVTGFDIDARKVSILDQGGSYIFRIPATEIQAAKKGGFSATAEYSRLHRDGRYHHLRPHPTERIPRARPEFHHRHGEVHRSPSSRRTSGDPREHDVSRYDGRSVDPYSGER